MCSTRRPSQTLNASRCSRAPAPFHRALMAYAQVIHTHTAHAHVPCTQRVGTRCPPFLPRRTQPTRRPSRRARSMAERGVPAACRYFVQPSNRHGSRLRGSFRRLAHSAHRVHAACPVASRAVVLPTLSTSAGFRVTCACSGVLRVMRIYAHCMLHTDASIHTASLQHLCMHAVSSMFLPRMCTHTASTRTSA